jgi:hypothetical protein
MLRLTTTQGSLRFILAKPGVATEGSEDWWAQKDSNLQPTPPQFHN